MKQLVILIAFLLILNACNTVEQVDFIIKNATIYTVDKDFSTVESMAVKQGMIVATGSDRDIQKNYRSDKVFDLEGKFVYPGFIDPHCHFFGFGLGLQEVDLTGTLSFAEVMSRVKEHAKDKPEGWIIGRGWDQNDWQEKSFPGKEELDRIYPDRPVILFRIDGHAALINSKAVEVTGIDPGRQIKGGEFRKQQGKFTGILIDNAVEMVRKKMPEPGRDQSAQALLAAQEKCFAVGLTSVHDAGLDASTIDLIDELNRRGQLKMRIYAMLNPGEENFKAYLYEGKYKTKNLNVSSVKLYADGALGSRGAKLIEPYSDDPSTDGLFVSSPEFIEKVARLADSMNYQVCTHCIGDGANRAVLKIYSGILSENNDKRWRIEHAQIVHPDDIDLFGKYNIVPSIQTTHATSDMYWAEERLGDRIRYAYPYHRLLEENGWLPNGSDFPVENINPLYGFYAAFTRQDKQGYPEGGFLPQGKLSREEALRAMTIWAAKAAFEEDEKGSLEQGKYADFVVLDRDIMSAEPKEILTAKVLQTFSSGEQVY